MPSVRTDDILNLTRTGRDAVLGFLLDTIKCRGTADWDTVAAALQESDHLGLSGSFDTPPDAIEGR